MRYIDRFINNNKGQGLVEYGLILALVSVVAVGALGGVGDKVSDTFGSVGMTLDGGIYSDEEINQMVIGNNSNNSKRVL